MAGLRGGLLVVLTGILFLDSVWSWEWIGSNELQNFYKTAEWGEQPRSPSGNLDYDEYDDYEDISESYSPSSVHHTFSENGRDSDSRTKISGTGSNFKVEPFNVHPGTWSVGSSPTAAWVDVLCTYTGFRITLLKGQMTNVNIVGLDNLLPVLEAPKSCGYHASVLQNTVTIPFSGCHVKLLQTGDYILQLLYIDKLGQTLVSTASCEGGLKDLGHNHPRAQPQLISALSPPLSPVFSLPVSTPVSPPASTPASTPVSTPATALAQTPFSACLVAPEERVACGQPGISSSDCETLGCCMDSATSACYYQLDVCTTDQQFVFAIRHNTAAIDVDPMKLVIPGTDCKPVLANNKVAIFKFKVTECGVRAYKIGVTTIYLARVQTAVNVLDLKYGVITRTDPLRFMIECRYSQKGNDQELLVSTGYMVKTPPSILPSSIIDIGLYAVQLRLAKDASYSSYFPHDHPPLQLLLGKPVYLELNLVTAKPDAVILVNYCLAYPLSAKNALVLIYEGCANPFDPSVSVLKVLNLPQNRHQRRFVVSAFQFMDQVTNLYLNEDIYFMCSTEVCRPTEKTCQDQCFDG